MADLAFVYAILCDQLDEGCHGAAGFIAYRKKLKLILGSSLRSSDQF